MGPCRPDDNAERRASAPSRCTGLPLDSRHGRRHRRARTRRAADRTTRQGWGSGLVKRLVPTITAVLRLRSSSRDVARRLSSRTAPPRLRRPTQFDTFGRDSTPPETRSLFAAARSRLLLIVPDEDYPQAVRGVHQIPTAASPSSDPAPDLTRADISTHVAEGPVPQGSPSCPGFAEGIGATDRPNSPSPCATRRCPGGSACAATSSATDC